MTKYHTAFYGVFKERFDKQKEKLKQELKLAKSDRRKDFIKSEIKEIKSLRDLLKEMDEQMGNKSHCPNCGHKL
jgi:hypothetical protein